MSANLTINAEKTALNRMYEAITKDAIEYALGNMSDDEMPVSKFNEEMEKAQIIMKGAIATIMRNCDFYGDESIYQFDNGTIPGKNTCRDFFITLVDSCCEDFRR